MTAVASLPTPPFSYAFQPIVDIARGEIYSYEALIRGAAGEPAGSVFAALGDNDLHAFDEHSRIAAVRLAARLGIGCHLNLNLQPRSLRSSATAISSTLEAACDCGLTPRQLIIEVVEGEVIDDQREFAEYISAYRRLGLRIAIDDFGAGYSGLNLLADFQPDIIKLDMQLVRDIAGDGPRQAIVRAVAQACGDLGIEVVAEGVESAGEYHWFRDEGIELFQGHLFGAPGFERLPQAHFPD